MRLACLRNGSAGCLRNNPDGGTFTNIQTSVWQILQFETSDCTMFSEFV